MTIALMQNTQKRQGLFLHFLSTFQKDIILQGDDQEKRIEEYPAAGCGDSPSVKEFCSVMDALVNPAASYGEYARFFGSKQGAQHGSVSIRSLGY
jgi:hypothetical protein